MKSICLAVTGASGAGYALRLLRQLISAECKVALLISRAAEVVIEQELEFSVPKEFDAQQQWFERYTGATPSQLKLYARDDWFAPVASGSAPLDAMIVCPASGGTLSAIAQGASNNLIERAADVCLKERRKLILVPRETPYSQIHLENMLKLTTMGAIIMPASPGFYQKPQCVDDVLDFVVARILDHIDVPQALLAKWGADL